MILTWSIDFAVPVLNRQSMISHTHINQMFKYLRYFDSISSTAVVDDILEIRARQTVDTGTLFLPPTLAPGYETTNVLCA